MGMHGRDGSWRAYVVTLLLNALMAGNVYAQAVDPPSKVQQRVQASPLSAAEQKSWAQTGTAAGQEVLTDAETNTLQREEGGPKGAGCTRVRGSDTCIDNEEMMGRGYDQTRVDRAGEVDGKMSSLKTYYTDESKRTTEDDGPVGAAYKASEDSADVKPKGLREVAETDWSTTRQAQGEGRAGSAQGMSFATCSTTTTVQPGNNPDAYLKEQHVCEIVNQPGSSDGEICTREREPTANQETVQGTTEAYLGTPGGMNETFCQRSTELEGYPVTNPFTKSGELDINAEVGGLSCSRNRWATWRTVTETRERTASLGVSTEMGGLSCTREIWPTSGTDVLPNSLQVTLSINNESGGWLCTRSRTVTGGNSQSVSDSVDVWYSALPNNPVTWVEDLSGYIPPGTVLANFYASMANSDEGECNDVQVIVAPTAANGFKATLKGWAYNTSNPYNTYCERGGRGGQVQLSWSGSVPGTKTFGLSDNGNCGQAGTANCPATWNCTANAPTTIGGIAVTEADVTALGALYPGASATCVAADLSKSCSGSADTSNTVSIAHLIPAGTTSIRSFTASQVSPQAGVTVTVSQTPSAANSWVAILKVSRASWTSQPSNPVVVLSWEALRAGVSTSIKDTGNCADPGSSSCPTQWSCEATAPATVNGITVDAAMAAARSPLFPGAANTCVKGTLNRVCSGSSSMGTTVALGDLIPAGVHSIQNFAFTVTNPQSGVTVTLAAAPTEANGWTASFTVARSTWTSVPVAPSVKITFSLDQQVKDFTLQETGNCADPGSTSCPTQWSCAQSAPTTINGIAITTSDVAGLDPLYPGAAGACVSGELKRVCTGASTTVTSIGIGDQIAPGTTAIQNFQYTYDNPDPSVIVTLVHAPSEANGWTAEFSVTRAMGSGAAPAKPHITLRWETVTTSYRAVSKETGDCTVRTSQVTPPITVPLRLMAAAAEFALDALVPGANAAIAPPTDTDFPPTTDPGSACVIKWTCTKSMPQSIAGIPVEQSMLDTRGPLYPGDGPPPSCLDAAYQRVCANGDAAGTTEVSIAQFLQPGTTAITNYSWTLIEPGTGVSVSSLQVPALDNNWVARFQVVRTDFSVAATAPKVQLKWDMPGQVTYTFPITDTGDCGGGVDDEFCKTEWTCDAQAPEPQRPLKSCGTVVTPWYDAAEARAGNSPTEKVFNLQSFVVAKTEMITKFKYAATTNVLGCEVAVSPFPPAYNAMNVTQVTRSTSTALCKPQIRFEWENLCPDESWVPPAPPSGGGGGGGGWGPKNPGVPVQQASLRMNDTQRFLAAVESVANAILPSAMAAICATCDQDGGGGYWDGGDIGKEPPLFPGDGPPATCMKATKKQDCTGIWTGTECTINSEGEEVCVTVDPDTPPNNDCPALEADPECTKIREECADGAMASSGWCYVKSLLYECKRKVDGGAADPVITETTTCNDADGADQLPAVCQDGSCTNDQVQTNSVGMSKAGAKMMMVQTIMNDTSKVGSHASVITTARPTVAVVSKPSAGDTFAAALLSVMGIGTAQAQSDPDYPFGNSDPFQIPDWAKGTDEDPTDGTGGLDGTALANMNVRFFTGNKRDCMKALGGLLNCCKKTPPQDQSPTLWGYIKQNLTKSNNAKGREDEADNDPSGYLKMLQGASQDDLMKMFTSNLDSLKGGGQGGDDNTDSSFAKSYSDFMKHETTVVKPRLAWYCDNDEFELAVGKQTGTCTHLGSFCQTKVLGMCIVKKDRYCCFNSPVTRILREHLDEIGIADLGTAKKPKCEGLTIEQISRMDLNSVDTNEIEGRMAQGQFNINIADLQSMSFTDVQSMFDGANSLIGDTTRVNPSDRNQGAVDTTDPSGAYSSLMGSQAAYRPTTAADTQAQDGTVGLDMIERELARGVSLSVGVQRIGSKGPLTVRAWTQDGTASAGTHYGAFNTVVSWADGETGSKAVLLKTHRVDGAIGRQNLTIKLEVISGNAKLDGNSEVTVWLQEQT